MLYFSLILSFILLFVVNLAQFRKRSPSLTAAVAGFILGIVPMVMCFMPLLALQGILLFLGSLVGVHSKARARYFLIYSCLVTIGIYAWTGVSAARNLESLRQRFPIEPLVERLPSRRPIATSAPLSASSADFLAGVEKVIFDNPISSSFRASSLRLLHEDKVSAFVDSPGFGITRMSYISESSLTAGLRKETSIPQPEPRNAWNVSSEPPGPAPRGLAYYPLNRLHLKGLLDFVNPRGFGLLTERKVLLGFQSHHFSEVPGETGWTIETIDLVGLVVHKSPVVYVSENLPRMSELRKAPTRSPDSFEVSGLEALKTGENLFVASTPSGLRMLGGVRAAEKCIECHGGKRGDLLGAFSYSLRGSGF
jgi:hypothetical protein